MARRLQIDYVLSGAETPQGTPETVVARENRRSWRRANDARLRRGRKKAIAMFTLKLNRVPLQAIAETFGTTRGAVYVRLHRLRSGFYKLTRRPLSGIGSSASTDRRAV